MITQKTSVRLEVLYMSGWTFFFLVVGITVLAAQLFRIIDFIERPAKRRTSHRRAAVAR